MFDPAPIPRVFAVPLGVDFPKALVDGLIKRTKGAPPEALARVQVIVNTRRMARRMRALFDVGPPVLLPQVTMITQPGETWNLGNIPEAVPPLKRRLELVQLVTALLDSRPDLAPRSSIYDLADSLAKLMDEMHGEGVSPEAFDHLDVTDHSGHWANILSFLGIIRDYFSEDAAPDPEARQRRVIEALIASWQMSPPKHPVILAGSTGSRGTTQILMQAVARLPQGAVILPGFDGDMHTDIWHRLLDAPPSEDHPQYRFASLMEALDLRPGDIQPWTDTQPDVPDRNAVLSLALRPAPVTDQWLVEGPKLTGIEPAMQDVTLVEAPSQRLEALTIAMRLRKAAEDGQTAALITPDRTLTRQVGAALDRWDILPDDSAGVPLHRSTPGRFLRHIADLLHCPLSVEILLTILKHPITHSDRDRGPHLRLTRELELHLRDNGPPFPGAANFQTWAAGIKDPLAPGWVDWLVANFCHEPLPEEMDLQALTDRHIALSLHISRGSTGADYGRIWQDDEGRQAHKTVSNLAENAKFGGSMRPVDYGALFYSILSSEQVRSARDPHPNIMIWGTLEARVQGADLLILSGLNEGSWPEAPSPDPWLNRDMRRQLGLLLPERRVGLSAHDFQQAAATKEVWLTRCIRSEDAQTVPSRWLNRLENLLSGLPDQGGRDALGQMKARGQAWISMAGALEEPQDIPAATRPSPCPPVHARPTKLSVTQIKTLIRDPFAIYARKVLKLRPLNPLMSGPDALKRGIALHKALENFVRDTRNDPSAVTVDRLMSELGQVLSEQVPWAEARLMWEAKVGKVAQRFIEGEVDRRSLATPTLFETRGKAELPNLGFTLTAEADRIDVDAGGQLHIYDYKTGVLPTESVQTHFDKQLLLEAAIAERSGFGTLPPSPVARAVFIGLGSDRKSEIPAPLDAEPPDEVWKEFYKLISVYYRPNQGFTSRRALQKSTHSGDYDHLARYGEWDMEDDPVPVEVG